MDGSRVIVVAIVLLAGFLSKAGTSMAYAQQSAPGAKRTVLERYDLSVPGHEGVLVQTVLDPGAKEPKHTHPGDFFAYVLEGTITLFREGQPNAHMNPGEVFFVPAGKVHAASNEGTVPVKLLVTFFVEKGKPLTTPVQ
jgi:quercetin dioxygenase-like cupin family protein